MGSFFPTAPRFQTQEEQMFLYEFELGVGSQCPRSKVSRQDGFSPPVEKVSLFILFGVSAIWMKPTITCKDDLLYSAQPCTC